MSRVARMTQLALCCGSKLPLGALPLLPAVCVGPPDNIVLGSFTVIVCGQPAARWHVSVTLDGQVIDQAHGIGLDSDTSFTKDENAGVLALTFHVP